MADNFEVRMRLPRQIKQGEIIDVKIKVDHPSDPGLALNEAATNSFERFERVESATFIHQIQVFYSDELVCTFSMNSSISDEPLIVFKLRADQEGPVRIVATNQADETAEIAMPIQFS